jgi:hypothetical protein
LTVEVVQTHGFASEELTEGKVAVNGDRATPVFSPCSGRVTRVNAGLGDTVKSGAPLATLADALHALDTAALFQALGGSITPMSAAPAAARQ